MEFRGAGAPRGTIIRVQRLGILTAGVAHRIPLNNISMMAQTYEELYAKLSEKNQINSWAKSTERIRKIHEEPPGLFQAQGARTRRRTSTP